MLVSVEFTVCKAKGMIAPSFGSNLVMRRDLMKVQTVILRLIKGVSRNYYNLVIQTYLSTFVLVKILPR